MAKTKKKKNYRLRKSVRRTLGALFMISAIIIAAIPFPDAAATEGESTLGQEGTTQLDPSQVDLPDLGNLYSYTEATAQQITDAGSVYKDEPEAIQKIDFKEISTDKDNKLLHKAMYIRPDGNDYMLIRQFDFVTRNFSGTSYGVITKYYDMFWEPELTLSSSVTTDYEMTSEQDITNFYADSNTGGKNLIYDKNDSDTDANEAFFKEFYPVKYQQYIDDEISGPLECNPAIAFEKNGSNTANRLKYYCWQKGFIGYTLFSVKDKASDNPTPSPDGSDPRIYVMKAISGYENYKRPTGYFDKDGFITGGDASIVAIGENAFTGVKNVDTIILPDTIKYIADNAFYNSFIDNVKLYGTTAVGHRAFKNCVDLESVTLPIVTTFGVEAFYGCPKLTDIKFNSSTANIHRGAFANCDALENVDLSSITSTCIVGEGAFFNCPLANLNFGSSHVDTLGDGAFATIRNQTDKLTKVDMSNSAITSYGKHTFSGREYLEDVIMSGNFGTNNNLSDEQRTLPETIFLGCSNLGRVKFPNNSKYVLYGKNVGDNIVFGQDENGEDIVGSAIFTSITNREFYVEGPMESQLGAPAYQRKETWICRNGAKDYVPYMYTENGQIYYEVKSGCYLLGLEIDKETQTAIVKKCELDTSIPSEQDGTLKINDKVGIYTIVGFAEGCFDDKNLKDSLTNLTINDTIESIGKNVFKDCPNLEKVTIGKSVTSIGEGAFENCPSLRKVIFTRTEDEIDDFPTGSIGARAFTTGSAVLFFEGVIGEGYAPFEWAMSAENFANGDKGIRVCYKSPKPSELFVILDNTNQLATLVHYPHYKDLANEYSTGETVSVREKNDTGADLNPTEENLVLATKNIIIPAGIESIDVKGFLNNSSELAVSNPKKNDYSITAYFGGGVSSYSNGVDDVDKDLAELASYKSNYATYGLFNGECGDDSNSSEIQDELKLMGNDRIERVEMNTVKYLPTLKGSKSESDPIAKHDLAVGAFYSCEDLKEVSIGDAMENLGTLPFLGCYNLHNIPDNNSYTCENGIIYKPLSDGSYELIEVLGSKEGTVDVANNPLFAKTSAISDGAFSDCPNLKKVSFKDAEFVKDIPAKCFLGSGIIKSDGNSVGNLEVLITDQVRTVGIKAFAESNDVTVTVEGTELGLPNNSFENTNTALVRSYYDSAAYNSGKAAGAEVETLDETYTVRFLDYDGSEFKGEDYAIQEGIKFMEYAKDPKIQPKREGYLFDKWYPDYKTTPITKDQDFIAQYKTDEAYYANSNNGNTGNNGNNNNNNNNNNNSNNGNNGNNGNTNNNNGDTNKGTFVDGGIDLDSDGIPDVDKYGNKLYRLTVTNGEGGGYYKAGQTVTIKAGNAPSGAGFAYWSCSNQNLIFEDYSDWITTLTMINSDVTVVCNFRGQYTLEVEYGSGSGSYPAGAKVAISAVEAPQGRKFASWKVKQGKPTVEDSKKETTFITMPAEHTKITATYMDTGKNTVSSNSTTSKNNTSVIITKPGISDKDKASAYVSGSSDNFIVKISESLDAADEVQRALQKKYPDMSRIKYFAMDITLYDAKGENKITNTNGLKVNITMPIPDALKEYAGNNRVGAVVNGELESLNPKFTTIDGIPSITFTATHFSPYTIYVDTGNMTVSNTLDSTPKTGDGIHPKWFLSLGLACISIILFTKRDRRYTIKA